MRAFWRLRVLLLVAVAGCNSIVGFGDFQKVTSSGQEPEDDDGTSPPDGGTSGGGEGGSSQKDGGPTTPTPCALTDPFDTPVPLAGPVNSGAAFEVAPSLTSDELAIVFQRTVGVEGGTVLMATRTSIDQPFGQPTELSTLGQGLQGMQQPAMTSDGLLLFFVGLSGADSDVFTASRAAINGTFAGRRVFDEVNSNGSESFPGVTPDGAEMWFSLERGIGNPRHLFRSVRDKIGAYGQPTAVSELTSSKSEAGVAFSADGLTIYFGSERDGGKGDSDIWTARRTSLTSPFGTSTPVSELNSASADYPGWLSTDGCRLYFASDRSGGGDIFVATRKR